MYATQNRWISGLTNTKTKTTLVQSKGGTFLWGYETDISPSSSAMLMRSQYQFRVACLITLRDSFSFLGFLVLTDVVTEVYLHSSVSQMIEIRFGGDYEE
jgi:hypothetical protein